MIEYVCANSLIYNWVVSCLRLPLEDAWRGFFHGHEKGVKGLKTNTSLPFDHLPLADAGYTMQNAREHFHVVLAASQQQEWPDALRHITEPLISILEKFLGALNVLYRLILYVIMLLVHSIL